MAIKPTFITIGLIFESLRVHKNISTKALSLSSDVSERTIKRVETEEVIPTINTCRRLSLALSVSWEDLELKFKFDRSPRKPKFRGGKQSKRDKEWSPFRDPEFRRWWHRYGKKDYWSTDIESEEEACAIYENWKKSSRNKMKLLSRF